MSNKCNCQIPNTDLTGRCFKCGGTIEIPADVQERIKADAEIYTKDEGYQKVYIAGATAERERAQVLVDALEAVKRLKELWLYTGKVSPEHEGEAQALSAMALQIETALQQWKGENPWQPIATAPRDGSTIEVSYDKEGKETCLAMWSENPICMLGSRTGSFPPGWATPPEADCDTNLPLDPPLMWRELTNPQK